MHRLPLVPLAMAVLSLTACPPVPGGPVRPPPEYEDPPAPATAPSPPPGAVDGGPAGDG